MNIWRITGRKGWKRLDYRNEWKYQVSGAQLAVLAARLSPILRPDGHHRPGGYAIRSLYFDDFSNSCLWENEAGVDDRRKYRLRIYNGDASLIKLEIKEKLHGMTHKTACTITPEQCRAIIRGTPPPLGKDSPPPMNLLAAAMRTRGLAPKVIVEYERTAYISRLGNVRITFDRNIATSAAVGLFLEPRVPLTPVLAAGQHVLEVKYDEFLPDPVAQVLELGHLRRTAFSKYYLSRLVLSEPLAERAMQYEF